MHAATLQKPRPFGGGMVRRNSGRSWRCGLESLAFAAPGASGDPPAASPLGFTPGSREGQLKAEALAVAVPTPENARSWLRP